MKALAALTFLIVAAGTLPVEARDEVDQLRARCTEQERQIRALEDEIERLHGVVALERRRSRGASDSKVASAPAPTAAPVEPKKPAEATYVVKSGDTLSSIARTYHTRASILMSHNAIADPTRLRVGQELRIPGTEAAAPRTATPPGSSTPVAASKPRTPGKHTVLQGETFHSVARRHEVSFTNLKALNPAVNPDRIRVGQVLTVAGTPPKPANLTSTRTISTAASPAKPQPKPAPAAKSKETPPVTSLPKPQPEPAAEPKPAAAIPSSIIVMEEISFGDFAAKHGTTTDRLNALNGLGLKDSTVLAKGSELYVPGS